MHKKLFVLLHCLFILNCASSVKHPAFLTGESTTLSEDSTALKRLAVLPIVCRGRGMDRGAGHVVADKLTACFYMEKGIKVADRSLVTAALEELRIENCYTISASQIRQLATGVNADILVLGTIDMSRQSAIPTQTGGELLFTLRYLEASTGNVVHLDQVTVSGHEPMPQLVDEAISSMVARL